MECRCKMWRYCLAVVALQLTIVGVERAGGSGQVFGYLSLVDTPQDSNNDPAVQRLYYAKTESRDDVWLVNSPDTVFQTSSALVPSPSRAVQSPSIPLPPSTATTRLKPPHTSRFPASTAVPSHTPTGSEAPPTTTPLPIPTLTTSSMGTPSSSIPAYNTSSFHTETTSRTSLGPIPPTSSTTSTVPSHSPEPSQDLNFQLILYTVPPLGFVVVVVMALFLVLCVHRYRKHRRYRHHLQMPLEEMDSSSEGDESDQEVNEEESQEAAFVVTHGKPSQPVLEFEET